MFVLTALGVFPGEKPKRPDRTKLGLGYASSRSLNFVCVFIGLMLFLIACVSRPISSSDRSADKSLIDKEAARELSDALESNLVNDDRTAMRSKLERRFRNTVDWRQFNEMVDQINETYGRTLAFEFKQEESGQEIYDNGKTKQLCKFWYAIRTTKFQQGSHFSIVEVVPEDNGLAVSSFSTVSFPSGLPQNLK